MAIVIKKVKLNAKSEIECDNVVKNALKNYPYALNSFGEEVAFDYCLPKTEKIAKFDKTENSSEIRKKIAKRSAKQSNKEKCAEPLSFKTETVWAKTEIEYARIGEAKIKTEITAFLSEDKNKKFATEIAKSIKKEIEKYCRFFNRKNS